jgi:hypothetical protein
MRVIIIIVPAADDRVVPIRRRRRQDQGGGGGGGGVHGQHLSCGVMGCKQERQKCTLEKRQKEK